MKVASGNCNGNICGPFILQTLKESAMNMNENLCPKDNKPKSMINKNARHTYSPTNAGTSACDKSSQLVDYEFNVINSCDMLSTLRRANSRKKISKIAVYCVAVFAF